MIVDADWDVMVGWTRTHTTKDQKAHATVEQKQIALWKYVGNRMTKKVADGDGVFFTERVVLDERATTEERHGAIQLAVCFQEKIEDDEDVKKIQSKNKVKVETLDAKSMRETSKLKMYACCLEDKTYMCEWCGE